MQLAFSLIPPRFSSAAYHQALRSLPLFTLAFHLPLGFFSFSSLLSSVFYHSLFPSLAVSLFFLIFYFLLGLMHAMLSHLTSSSVRFYLHHRRVQCNVSLTQCICLGTYKTIDMNEWKISRIKNMYKI